MDKTKDKTENYNRILSEIIEATSMITGIDEEDILSDVELFAFGFDSMLLMALGKQINSKYQIDITLDLLVTSLNTLEKLAAYISENIDDTTLNMTDETPSSIPLIDDVLDEIKDDTKYISVPEEIKTRTSTDFNIIKELFDNQLAVIQEQNTILKDLVKKEKDGSYISFEPDNVKAEENKVISSTKQSNSTKQSSNYFVPYKKIDLQEQSAHINLQNGYNKEVQREYNRITKGSKEATSNYRKVHAEWRNITGFRPSIKELIYPIYAQKGKGSKLIDLDGNEFIDMTMGFGVNLFGNNPEFIKEALQKALEGDGVQLGPLEILPGEVAEKIADLTGVERVYFCNTGTEANMVAVRIARAVTGKDKVVCFTGSYHGNHDGLLGIPIFSGEEVATKPMAPGITSNTVKDLILLEYDSEDSLKYIEEHGDEIAAVLTETVQSRRPDLQPKEFLHKLREVTKEHNVALIFDEVITGFRIGPGGAQEFFGVEADIVTYGKVIGGGMPIGVVAGKSQFLDSIDGGLWNYGDDSLPPNDDKRTFVGGTFCHNHLTMIASNAVLDYIKENKDTLYQDLNMKTRELARRINLFFKQNDINLSMNTFGSLFRFTITPNLEIFYYGLLKKGIYVWEGRNFFLSTEHTQEDIEKIYNAVTETAMEMKSAGYFSTNGTSRQVVKTIPMSLIQQRLYSHILIEESDPFDLVGAAIVMGDIDIKMLEDGINHSINRHESLRTSLHLENGEFIQKIHPTAEINIKEYFDQDRKDINTLINDSIMKFDLSQAPLLEVLLLHTFDDKKVLVFHAHHTIADGISMGILINEIADYCNNIELSEVKLQYEDFVDWEKNYLASDQLAKDRKFFMDKLADCVCSIPLPYNSYKRENASYEGSNIYEFISPEMLEALKETAKQNSVSLYMILFAALNIMLHKISGEKSIAVTTPVSSRFDGGFEENIGMFTNTLVINSEYSKDQLLKDYLQKFKITCISSYEHINYPFNLLVNELNTAGEGSFNVMFGYENAETRMPEINGVELMAVEYVPDTKEFDISFDLQEKNNGIEIDFSYRKDIFHEESINLLLERYLLVLKQLIENSNQRLSDINILTDNEYDMVISQFNNTAATYSKDKTIVDLFEAQVRKTPDRIALIFDGRELTYSELNEKANQVAGRLIRAGVCIEDTVCLMAERSIETIICIHGILKAGGVYMPVDPRYPEERIRHMLEDSKPKVVLLGNMEVPKGLDLEIINIFDEDLYTGDRGDIGLDISPQNLVHIMYTSGTTGNPKGVLSTHTGLVNRIEWMQKMYPMYENDTILQKTTYTFDDSVYEVLWSSCVGARLAILKPGGELEVDQMAEAIKDYHVTHMLFVPTVLKELLRYTEKKQLSSYYLSSLRLVVSSGEALTDDLISLFNKALPWDGCQLANLYGPTEVSIDSTYYNCTGEEEGNIPIGKPIDNTSAYVLRGDDLCGIDMIGELCIGGVGVARGYLNNPELTEERFIDNPYGEGKLYRSGDLVKWLPDGNLEYLGRVDEQVKIHGQRVELGEIESALRNINHVEDVAVITRSEATGEMSICAYLKGETDLNMKSIRDQLRTYLPEYMIPAYMMQIDYIPLNSNGKVNKKALPYIEVQRETEYVAPANDIEKDLCGIFEEVLGVKQIGIQDSFLELGGDSIKAIKVVSKLRDIGYEISIRSLLEKSTIANIADAVVFAKENPYYQGEVTGIIDDTPMLKEFAALNLAVPNHYNQAVLILIDTEDEELIKEALNAVVSHHDVLRSVYRNGQLIILSKEESLLFDFEAITVNEPIASQIEKECNRIQQSIDLEKGPLVKAALFKAESNNYIFLCIHHLLVDSVSFEIIGEDLSLALTQLRQGTPIALPQKTASYLEWGDYLEDYRNSSDKERELDYWKKLSIEAQGASLDTYGLRSPDGNNGYFDELTGELSSEDTNNLLYKSGKAFNSEVNDLLIAALGLCIRKLTGQDKLTVWMEGHGREQLHKTIDLDRTVGWFTSLYPIVIPCELNIEKGIVSTKETIRRVPNHGAGYGVLNEIDRIDKCICFNYLGSIINENIDEEMAASIGRSIAKENRFIHSINLEAYVSGETMKLSLIYDSEKYHSEDMKQLLTLYMSSLCELVDFCSTRDYVVNTASDYGALDLEEMELNEIISMLE